MRKVLLTFTFIAFVISAKAQIDAGSLMGLPRATTVEMNGITGMVAGQSLFNTDEGTIYYYTGTVWERSTDSQTLSTTGAAGQISVSGGNAITLNVDDADANATNELQDLALDVNNILTLSNPATSGNQVDLSGLLNSNLATDNLTQDAETRTFDMNGQDLNFSNGSFGVGTTNPAGTFEGRSNQNENAFNFVQENNLTGERDVFTIEDQDVGGGGQDESSVLKVVKSGNINSSDLGFSLIELANTGTDPGDDKFWISGRTTDEGAPLWGVDITDNDFWSEGGIVLGVTGADGGTYSGGNFIVEPDGDTGIGTTTPDARLDVEGGNVRFSDYGDNTVTGTPTSLVGIESDGDLVEVNTVTSSRIFYPPSIAVDASTNGTFTIDLHAQYVTQFGSPTVASAGAPAAVPTYAANELYYYITFADPAVFDTTSTSGPTEMRIDADGMLTYTVIAQPVDFNALINVVFVVK